MSVWVVLTIFAALMQALRTSLQRQLSRRSTALTTTLARYFYALPLVWGYLLFCLHRADLPLSFPSPPFWGYAIGAALAQILATLLMVKLFQQRNYAIGICYAKTEAVMIAIIGALFFASTLTPQQWLSVVAGVIGILLLSPRTTAQNHSWREWLWNLLFSRSAILGLMSGITFALTSLWARQASLTLNLPAFPAAATTLAMTITLQWILVVGYQLLCARQELKLQFKEWRLSAGVGVMSLAGSIGWFTAMTLENPALVKTLGQLEFFFSLIIALKIFKERFTLTEYLGMAAIIASIIGVLLH